MQAWLMRLSGAFVVAAAGYSAYAFMQGTDGAQLAQQAELLRPTINDLVGLKDVLIEETTRLVVRRQISYGAERGVPWGVSESAFNARDLDLTYQYSGFGVPGLGLKRGLSEDLVIAPYATALAAMVDDGGIPRPTHSRTVAISQRSASGRS